MKTNITFTQKARRGFSLVEVLIAMSIAVVVGGMSAGFALMSSKSAIRITNQSELNSTASNAALMIVQRTRSARLSTVSNGGNTLVLTFDDYGYSDSDGDGNYFNDSNHVEVFQFYDTDGDLTTMDDNGISYRNSRYNNSQKDLVTHVQKIGDAAIFSVNAGNSRQIDISFEASKATTDGQRQRTEIVTSAYRLN